MDLVSLFIAACAVWWLLSLLLLIGSTVAACIQPILRRRQVSRQNRPPISVIIPVKDLAPELEAAFVSLLSQTYPKFEVLVSAAEDSSPPLELARTVAARFPRIKSRFISHDPQAAINPKLNNLTTPLLDADYDLICVKDSNIQFEIDQLSELERYFTEKIGLVVAVPIGTQPENFSAQIECAFMNNYVARFLLAASAIGWGFGIGAVMLFNRQDLNRAGGIASIASAIGEDHALSKALGRIGLKTIIAASIVKQTVNLRRYSDVWARQLRWLICRRVEEPIAYYAEPFIGAVFTTASGAIGASFFGLESWVLATSTIFVWVATEVFFNAIKGWVLSWKSPFAIICSELMLPMLWLQAILARKISWGKVSRDIRRVA